MSRLASGSMKVNLILARLVDLELAQTSIHPATPLISSDETNNTKTLRGSKGIEKQDYWHKFQVETRKLRG